MYNLSSITVAILAGGLGRRLQIIVNDRPKVLAKVGNTPFLQKLLDQLDQSGFKKVVLCVGYLGDQIRENFGSSYKSLNLLYSYEESSLGTAGALRRALPLLKSETVLLMNGDSFCDINFGGFLKFHLNKKADVSIAVLKFLNSGRFGKVNLGLNDKIVGFEEKKEGDKQNWINAGIYLIKRSFISQIADNREVSLEREVFPTWIGKHIYGYKSQGVFIDIGIPESFIQAERFFKVNSFFKKKAKRFILLDRDGTLIVHKPYLSHPDQIELVPGVIEALKKFKKMGLGVLIVTNQSGVGRGYFNLKTLKKIHQRLNDLLTKERVFLDGIYFCPHIPEDNCLCRKPKVELINRAVKKHHFDPTQSFVIGDNESDIELGKNIGATTFLVRTGYGSEIERKQFNPDFVVDSLKETLPIILSIYKNNLRS